MIVIIFDQLPSHQKSIITNHYNYKPITITNQSLKTSVTNHHNHWAQPPTFSAPCGALGTTLVTPWGGLRLGGSLHRASHSNRADRGVRRPNTGGVPAWRKLGEAAGEVPGFLPSLGTIGNHCEKLGSIGRAIGNHGIQVCFIHLWLNSGMYTFVTHDVFSNWRQRSKSAQQDVKCAYHRHRPRMIKVVATNTTCYHCLIDSFRPQSSNRSPHIWIDCWDHDETTPVLTLLWIVWAPTHAIMGSPMMWSAI